MSLSICASVCVFAFVSFLFAQLNSCHFPFTITGTYSLTSTVLKHSHSQCVSLGGGAPPRIACGAADVYCSCLFASVSPPLGSFVHPFLSRPHSSCRSLLSFRFHFLSSAPFPLFRLNFSHVFLIFQSPLRPSLTEPRYHSSLPSPPLLTGTILHSWLCWLAL